MLRWRSGHRDDPGAHLSALQLLTDRLPGEPLLDTALSRALLLGVAEGRLPATLRIYRPDDVLAFSLLDRAAAGFQRATRIATEQGFAPVLRLAGGRAAVFHRESVAFAWSRPAVDLRDGIESRYEEMGNLLVTALRSLGVEAGLGELTGEYCPGRFSVHAGGRVKLAGIGQRVVRGAAHVGGVVVVRNAARVRDVLVPIYKELQQPLQPETVGAASDEVPDLSVGQVMEALRAAFASRYELVGGVPCNETLARARSLAAEHDPFAARAARRARPLAQVPKGVVESR